MKFYLKQMKTFYCDLYKIPNSDEFVHYNNLFQKELYHSGLLFGNVCELTSTK
jgi:hypothetical protein